MSGIFSRLRKGSGALAPSVDRRAANETQTSGVESNEPALTDTGKTYWQRRIPVIACGAGLFSDGYLNSVRPRSHPKPRTCVHN